MKSTLTQQLGGLGLALALITGTAFAQTKGTIEIKRDETVPRTYDAVKADGYAYGPKQEFDATAKETHIWLPYGSKGVYNELVGVQVIDPAPGRCGMMMGTDGFTCVTWGYKLHFDKPISGFRMLTSLAEIGLKNAVAGVEYSVDGQKWIPLKESEKNGIDNKFVNPATAKVTGLKTQDLYLRFFSRDKANPTASRADGAFFKMWTCGDPGWGDANTTFFNIQPQVWVTAAE